MMMMRGLLLAVLLAATCLQLASCEYVEIFDPVEPQAGEAEAEDASMMDDNFVQVDTNITSHQIDLGAPEDRQETDEENDAHEEEEPAGVADTARVMPDEWSPENEYDLIKFFNGLYYNQVYGKINDKLVDSVATNNTRENMDFALDWLARETQTGIAYFKRPLIQALRQFTALASINEQFKCNRNTYGILFKNNKATKDKAHRRPSQVGPFKRIEQLIHVYNLKHAIACLPLYPERFREISDRLDVDSMGRVERFYQSTILKHLYEGSCSLLGICKRNQGNRSNFEIVRAIKSLKNDAGHAYDSISSSASGDPDARYLGLVLDEKQGKMVIVKEKVEELFVRYLVEPCRYYVLSTGPDVFIPAKYDAAMLEREDRAEMARSEDVYQFVEGYAKYRLCQLLIKSKDSFVKNIVSEAQRRAKID